MTTDTTPGTPHRPTEAQARAFHEMTQVGGPWSPCSGTFGEPLDCLCYEMASDVLDAFRAASPATGEGLREALAKAVADMRGATAYTGREYTEDLVLRRHVLTLIEQVRPAATTLDPGEAE